MAGMNKMVISKYETGKSTPNIESLGKIAKALNITVDSLIFDDEPDKNRLEFKDVELIDKIKEVEKLSNEDRKVIKTLIDAMLAKRKIEKIMKSHY